MHDVNSVMWCDVCTCEDIMMDHKIASHNMFIKSVTCLSAIKISFSSSSSLSPFFSPIIMKIYIFMSI